MIGKSLKKLREQKGMLQRRPSRSTNIFLNAIVELKSNVRSGIFIFSRQTLFVSTVVIVFALFFTLIQSVQASSDFVFNKNLQNGNKHTDVRELQRFLNNNGFALSATGVGSLGRETTAFGSVTKNALIRFQKANNIVPAVGYFGPVTRAVINKMASSSRVDSNVIENKLIDVQREKQEIGRSYYSVGGSITGIVGAVVLQNNGKDDLIIDIGQNSDFTFPAAIANGTDYSVTVKSKNVSQNCYSINQAGVINGADIKNIKIVCGADLYFNPFTFVPGGGGGGASYSLSYAAGAGGSISGVSSQTVHGGSSGSSITAVPDTGYHFVSWSDGYSTAERTDASVAANKSVSATFSINTYTVTFDTNGGDGGSTAAQVLNYNTPTALTTNGFTRTGYTFAGWATSTSGVVAYTNGASYTISAGNVTLYAKWNLALAIGNAYQGGKIAYIFQSGDLGYVAGETHGLIAATADQSMGTAWAKAASQSVSVPSGTLAPIGRGSENTDHIIAQNGLDSTYAAGIARSYAGGDYHDWYLPSRDELNTLFTNRVIIGGFDAAYYWSSTEGGVNTAWTKHLSVGSESNQLKSNSWNYVRAIRSF